MTPSCLENPAMARSVEGGGSQSQSRKALNFGLKPVDRPVLCGSGRCGAVIRVFCARGVFPGWVGTRFARGNVFTGWVERERWSRHALWHGAETAHSTPA